MQSHSISRKLWALIIVLTMSVVGMAQTSAREQAIRQIQDLMQQGDPEPAHQALRQALQRYPGDPGLENLRGIMEAQAGNFPEAERAFAAAIARSPRFVNAYLNLGRLYQQHGEIAKALQTYRKLLRFQPAHAEANYQCAALLVRKGEAAGALPHLERLSAELRQGANVQALLIAGYQAAGDRARGQDTIERLIAHPELNELDVLPVVPALVKHGGMGSATRLLEEVTRRGAGPDAHRQLGLLYEEQNRLEAARAALERAGTPNVPLLLDLARVAYRQNDFRGALGYLAHARDLEPANARINYLFGQTCIRLELVAEAHQSFVKAVSLEPNNPDYNYAAGAAAAYFRDPVEAIPYFQKYLQLRPGDLKGRLLLGAVQFKAGDPAAARRELQAALAGKETAANAHYYLGRIARQEGDLPEAIRQQQLALAGDPQLANAMAELGQCYLQQRDYASSEKMLRQALAIDPENYLANFALLTLYSRTRDSREASQAEIFERVKQRRTEREQDFLRAIETRPR